MNKEEKIWKTILGVPCNICGKVMHEPKKRDKKLIQEPIVLKKGHLELTHSTILVYGSIKRHVKIATEMLRR